VFDELMIHSEHLSVRGEREVALEIRLPWYRSLPMSCIERLEFTVDGVTVPAAHTVLVSDGIPYAAEKLAQLCDTQWFVLDTKQARLTLDGPLTPGEHDVSLLMSLRIPYRDTNYGVAVDEKYVQFAICSKKLTV